MHEGIEALVGLFMPCVGEVYVNHGGFELGMSQGALDEPGIDTRFEQRGGVRMPQGRHGPAHCGHAGTVFGGTEGALDTGPTHGVTSRRTLLVIPSGGGKEPGCMTMGFPGGAEQSQRSGGQGDVTIVGALAAVDMDLEALAINV